MPGTPTASASDRGPVMLCLACGYSLRGLASSACPECGRAFDPCDPKSFATRSRWRWRRAIRLAVAALLVLLLAYPASYFALVRAEPAFWGSGFGEPWMRETYVVPGEWPYRVFGPLHRLDLKLRESHWTYYGGPADLKPAYIAMRKGRRSEDSIVREAANSLQSVFDELDIRNPSHPTFAEYLEKVRIQAAEFMELVESR